MWAWSSGRCDRNGLIQHFLCFLDATSLAERRREPAILVRVIGVSTDTMLSGLNRSVIFAGQVIADRNIEQLQMIVWVVWVEPNTFLQGDAPFLRMPGPRQHPAEGSMSIGQVRTYRQSASILARGPAK